VRRGGDGEVGGFAMLENIGYYTDVLVRPGNGWGQAELLDRRGYFPRVRQTSHLLSHPAIPGTARENGRSVAHRDAQAALQTGQHSLSVRPVEIPVRQLLQAGIG
jgi:hypothetical protein